MKTILSAAILCCIALSAPLRAQGVGEFVGTVTDPSGAVIAGAKVTVTEAGTGFARSVVTGAEGFFTVPSLRPSDYNLRVEAAGFRTYSQTGVTLAADQSATVNVKLEVGATTETVNIVADSVQVDTTTSTIRQVVDGERIVDIPLNGRNRGPVDAAGGGDGPVAERRRRPGPDQDLSRRGDRLHQRLAHDEHQLPARRRQQRRRIHQRQRAVSLPRRAAGIQRADHQLQRRVRPELRRRGQHHHQVRHQRSARRSVRLPPQQRLQRPQLFLRQGRSAQARPVRRHRRRSGRTFPDVYNGKDKTFFFFGYQGTTLRNLQGSSSAFVPTPRRHRRRFLGGAGRQQSGQSAAQSHHHHRSAHQPAVRRQHDSRLPIRSQPSVNVLSYLPQAGGNGSVFYTKPVSQNFNEAGGEDRSFLQQQGSSHRPLLSRQISQPGHLRSEEPPHLHRPGEHSFAERAGPGDTHLGARACSTISA